ncbi:MAG TPA: chemotaxis protein CheB, partial [Kofleriaceae bacterium]|nr:chemotaxis protein CheB [Kofleriaceae bacterium]
MATRDVVAIGCSAGGIEALPRILQQLPADLPASVLIVQHLASDGPRYLASMLANRTALRVVWADQGARISPGCAYVAPPDVHFLVADGHVRLTRSARENHARPSIDKLFRSVAAEYPGRALGVLLTGMLDDGVAGLRAIRDAGGEIIVQDPDSAAYPDLPGRAVLALAPERVLPIDAIGGSILALLAERATPRAPSRELVLEASFDRQETVTPAAMDQLGTRTPIACPECHGPMWQLGDDRGRRYRCYLGHVTTATQLVGASTDEVEAALWSAVRALHDRALTLETLAGDAR